MLELLPSEILHRILGRLILHSDLKAVCRTSKTLCDHASLILYSDITLNISNPDNHAIRTFVDALCSRRYHDVRIPKSLTFIDGEAPAEIHSIPQARPSTYVTRKVRLAKMNCTVYFILQLLPKNVLLTFRFISPRQLESRIFTQLVQRQHSLQHLHATFEPPFAGLLGPQYMVAQVLQPALKVLEIQIREGRGLRLFMPSLVHRGTGLRSLCIVDGNVQQQTIDWKKATFSTSNVAWVLRELTLVNVTLQGAFTALLRLIPFDGIKKLALLKCEGSNTFLKDMAAHYTGKKHGLRHLSVDLSDDQERDHDTLKAIYKICQDLQSLHLEWCGGPIDKDDEDSDYWPHYLDKEVGTLGESLTTLSVHTHVDIRYSDPEDEYDVSDIAKICMSCPKIRQIAFQHDMAIGTHDLMVLLGSLPHLEILHLRHDIVDPDEGYGTGNPSFQQECVRLSLQHFVNQIFQYTHDRSHCPKLQAIVYGTQPATDGQTFTRSRRFCFIKGQQTDVSGRTMQVGVPVSIYYLRRMAPDLDILDLEPGRYSNCLRFP